MKSSFADFCRDEAGTIRRAYDESGAARWGIGLDRFVQALDRSVARRLSECDEGRLNVASYIQSLHLRDFALAIGCADGQETAWESFVTEFRPELYRAARAVAGPERARELADSLYGDLFGVSASGAERRSLFLYFHGRSRLLTWLRSVLAQQYVNRLREGRRLEPLAEDAADVQGIAQVGVWDPHRGQLIAALQRSVDRAMAALVPPDRLRLTLYYGQRLTLAEIGRALGEHEATASRKLTRVRKDLRARISKDLRDVERLTDAQVTACFEHAASAAELDLGKWLTSVAPTEADGDPDEKENPRNPRMDLNPRNPGADSNPRNPPGKMYPADRSTEEAS